jgi:hypothetical protein
MAPGLTPAPIWLDLALTARCPLRCRFCTVEKAETQELSAAKWRSVIRAFAARRTIRLISLEGGEPLLRRDLPEILAAGIAHAQEVKLVTGGGVAFSALPPALSRHPRFTLEVSVDGPEETHNWLRDGSWTAAWDFIGCALDHGVRLRLRTVVSVFNIGCLPEWLTALDRMLAGWSSPVGFRCDTLIAPEALAGAGGPLGRPGFRDYASRGLLPTAGEVRALFAGLRRRRFRRLRFEQTEPFRGCGAGRLPGIAIDPAGRFSFCCEAPGSCGSIAEVPVAQCLELLDRETAALPCRACDHLRRHRCDGCWTGQKCGMVGHWGMSDCRALFANRSDRPGRRAPRAGESRRCPQRKSAHD